MTPGGISLICGFHGNVLLVVYFFCTCWQIGLEGENPNGGSSEDHERYFVKESNLTVVLKYTEKGR